MVQDLAQAGPAMSIIHAVHTRGSRFPQIKNWHNAVVECENCENNLLKGRLWHTNKDKDNVFH